MALRTSRGDQDPDENEIQATSTTPKYSEPGELHREITPTATSHETHGSHHATGTLTSIWSAYKFDLVSAIKAGITATVFFLAFWYPLYFSTKDPSLDVALLVGAFLTPNVDWTARLLGFGGLFGMGIGMAVFYGLALLAFKMQSGMNKGIVFGLMVFVPMMAFVLPFSVGFLARFGVSHAYFHTPDVLLNQVGNTQRQWETAVGALIAHIFFGAFLGLVYRHKEYDGVGTRYEVEYAGG